MVYFSKFPMLKRAAGAACRFAVLVIAVLFVGCRGGAKTDVARIRLVTPPHNPTLMFVSVATDDTFKHVSLAPLAAVDREAFVTPLTCERVYFSGHRGICLTLSQSGVMPKEGEPPTVWADVFDERFERLHRFTLKGAPSRVRVSPDGRRAGATMFDAGHSYAQSGFSTITTIFDLEARIALGDLEDFPVYRDGDLFWAEDFNFWGITFDRDGDTFYATLATDGRKYLVRGSVDAWQMTVIHTAVECPSLSPDGQRIAFKKRIGKHAEGWWQIAVLDLASMRERTLWKESRSIDDQVEWLDNNRLLYGITGSDTVADVWVLNVDDATPARPFVHGGYSPAAVR
jgi:WD40 repeat protein